jgi:hypothetical protein
MLRLVLDLEPVRRLVARRSRVNKHVESVEVVVTEDALHEMRERVIPEIGRDVTDVDLAVERRSRRRVNDRGHPRLVERRMRDTKSGSMRNESGFASGDGQSEAMEGEDSRNWDRWERRRKSRASIRDQIALSRNDSKWRSVPLSDYRGTVGRQVPPSLDSPHQSLDEANEVSSFVDGSGRVIGAIVKSGQS